MNQPRPDIANEWPADGLEPVRICPICQGQERRLLYAELEDELFVCAPGKWTLYECSGCGTAYLDPRPTPDTIGLAYSCYYTHGSEQPTVLPEAATIRKRLSALLKNSYLEFRYGVSLAQEPKLPKWLFRAFCWALPIRPTLDRWVRHLPPPTPGFRLLDAGCGNGYFLQIAKFIGWPATGIDVDPAAVENARKLGLNVLQGNLYRLPFEDGSFDVVTLNQVIEHLHDPLAALREMLRVLQPGGMLWLSTPNLDSKAHARAGAKWLHLDPPRHLILFDQQALTLACQSAGFPHPVRRRVAWTDRGDWELIVTAQKPSNDETVD